VARAIWTGHLSFGLVNVPVGLYSATEDHTVHFHQFEKGTSSRIRYKRVNEDTGKEVAFDDIVKGADVGKDQYVMLAPEELETVEPGRSRTIEIGDFVDVEEIDPIFYQKTYYLAPSDESGQKAYGLLLQAMEQAGRVGIATFVMRAKQYLAAIRPQNKVLTLETMFFADEVRDPKKEIGRLPGKQSLGKKDVDMAISLIESMTTPWEPKNYRDTYQERVRQLIKAKQNDEEVVGHEGAEPEEGEVTDLLAALQASVDQARGHRAGNRSQGRQKVRTTKKAADKSATNKAGTKKTASKKAASKKAASKKAASKKATTKKAATKKAATKSGGSQKKAGGQKKSQTRKKAS
jgi:DNA end-binding protein Ku